MEPRPYLDQRREAAADSDFAGRWRGDLRQELEDRALAGPVVADDAYCLASGDFKTDVAKRPEFIGLSPKRLEPLAKGSPAVLRLETVTNLIAFRDVIEDQVAHGFK